MTLRPIILTLFAAILLVLDGIAPAFATPTPPHAANSATAQVVRREEEPEHPTLGPLTPSEKQAFGCLVAGGTALAIAVASTGLPGMVGLFTGTTVVPVTGTGLGLVASGTIFASTCAVGALVTPGILRLWNQFYAGVPVSAAR